MELLFLYLGVVLLNIILYLFFKFSFISKFCNFIMDQMLNDLNKIEDSLGIDYDKEQEQEEDNNLSSNIVFSFFWPLVFGVLIFSMIIYIIFKLFFGLFIG